MESVDLSEKISYLMRKNNISSPRELASKTDVPYTTILSILNKTVDKDGMRIKTLLKFSEYFNVTLDSLISNESNESSQNNKSIIYVYGTIPAGIPMECIDDIIDTEEIESSMLKGGKQYFGLKVKGDSMYPEYLDGDTLILLKQDNCESGDDCVVMVNGNDGTFKRVFKNENGIVLQPLNNAYQPMIYSNEQIENLPVKIIGIVEEIRRKKRKK